MNKLKIILATGIFALIGLVGMDSTQAYAVEPVAVTEQMEEAAQLNEEPEQNLNGEPAPHVESFGDYGTGQKVYLGILGVGILLVAVVGLKLDKIPDKYSMYILGGLAVIELLVIAVYIFVY